MKSYALPVFILLTAVLIAGVTLFSGERVVDDSDVPINNVSIIDGKQIIVISAKGGYQPRNSVAKAGIPTILRFNTKGTFDCSSSVVIPSLNISKNLPPSGNTDIDLGSPQLGVLQGTCGMGMYRFQINFGG